jgi:hypothetical protein
MERLLAQSMSLGGQELPARSFSLSKILFMRHSERSRRIRRELQIGRSKAITRRHDTMVPKHVLDLKAGGVERRSTSMMDTCHMELRKPDLAARG